MIIREGFIFIFEIVGFVDAAGITYTTKCTCEKSSGKEENQTFLELETLVVHGDEICTAWEDTGFEDSEEETADKETGEVADKTLADSGNT